MSSISLADILTAVEVIQQKEAADGAALNGIGNATFESLRPTLIAWANSGFPPAYTLMDIPVIPPTQCSDGVTRDLTSYIVFCSGKTLQEHVALLQEKLTDMTVSFANVGQSIAIVVTRSA